MERKGQRRVIAQINSLATRGYRPGKTARTAESVAGKPKRTPSAQLASRLKEKLQLTEKVRGLGLN